MSKEERHEVSPENAAKFRDWIARRGGVAVWHSINLSNIGASWSTPALREDGTPTPKPTWEADDKPANPGAAERRDLRRRARVVRRSPRGD
jgi:hypothetical protein